MSYAKVLIVGNLGRDPEMRYLPSGTPVVNFSVAANEKWTDNGAKQERVTWFRVGVFGKAGEACNTYLHKGSLVLVEGRLNANEQGNPRTWQAQDGSTRASFEVTALTVKFLSSGNGNGHSQPAGEPVEAVVEEAEIPF